MPFRAALECFDVFIDEIPEPVIGASYELNVSHVKFAY
jgi:hypothetical protein